MSLTIDGGSRPSPTKKRTAAMHRTWCHRNAVPITSIISFLVLAVEEIAVEIENPFGLDPNDLPLHTYCLTVQADALRLLDEARDRERQERAGGRGQ